jgi:hypothetical protein
MQTIQVTSGQSLIDIAAVQLQDATQWIRIATENGLRDFIIQVNGPLVIPDVNLALTGGVPPQ